MRAWFDVLGWFKLLARPSSPAMPMTNSTSSRTRCHAGARPFERRVRQHLLGSLNYHAKMSRRSHGFDADTRTSAARLQSRRAWRSSNLCSLSCQTSGQLPSAATERPHEQLDRGLGLMSRRQRTGGPGRRNQTRRRGQQALKVHCILGSPRAGSLLRPDATPVRARPRNEGTNAP
jgi:hypothetical protein